MHKALFVTLAIVVLAGCSQIVQKEVSTTPIQSQKAPVEQVDKAPLETVEQEYKTFTSEDFCFSVDVPADWDQSQNPLPQIDSTAFSFRKDNFERAMILPRC